MKIYNIIFSFIILHLIACSDGQKINTNAGNKEGNIEVKPAASNSVLSIPQTSDAELKQFYVSYKSNLDALLLAVRKNDAIAIKEAYSKYDLDFDNIGKMTEKAMALGGKEEENFFQYIDQTQPIMTEIHASPTVMELDNKVK